MMKKIILEGLPPSTWIFLTSFTFQSLTSTL